MAELSFSNTEPEFKIGSIGSLAQSRNIPRHLNLDHVTPATRLLEKRRQMFEVQEALEAQKEEFSRREELFKRREEALRKKDLELQESLIKFSKFLQENDSKRSRAEKKAADEVALRIKKESEISKLKADLQMLKQEKQAICGNVSKNMRYQKYLEEVLEITEEYPEINDLLMRHATLQATNDDLQARTRQLAEENEQQRLILQKFLKDKTDENLGYNNETAALQKTLEGKVQAAQNLQASQDTHTQERARKTKELGQIQMACGNIFSRIISKSKVRHQETDDVQQQLKVISEFMTDLKSIVDGGRQYVNRVREKAAEPPPPQQQPLSSIHLTGSMQMVVPQVNNQKSSLPPTKSTLLVIGPPPNPALVSVPR